MGRLRGRRTAQPSGDVDPKLVAWQATGMLPDFAAEWRCAAKLVTPPPYLVPGCRSLVQA